MKSDNVVQNKSYDFALRIVKVYRYLSQEKKEFVLSKQLLRSGTSVGANIEEAIGGQSKADFFAKLTIAYKEARESKYWIRLLRDSDYLTIEQSDDLLKDVEELLKIIGSIQKSIRNS
ncbi:four helix bundle protein [Flavobacterium granuli]|jgi:four helix bundle protein|uniref:Four helix bundle protein n=1 Tax=Flavobacterium granuli TaxID=280093 RepID=A0ABU1S0Y7_9FLAO|nr:four helix bundle protein [Flavobacterium granuli]MDR6843830.1 four helix bundle protein [Flavobacterium granuli]